MEMVSVKSEENNGKRSIEAPEAELQKCIKRRKRDPNAANNGRELAQPSSTTTGGAKRSSRFRGVSRHRWTGRFEAHLWDKESWNVTQKKKGKQVYLGAYDQEEAAARAYDLAALKYWGPTTFINFPISNYDKDIQLMQKVTKEEYLASLRRKSSGFSRGVSKYRGVARHHHNGRWEARIGRIFGNKYLYLGTYSTQEEAAAAYDIAAIEYRGINAVTNFDLSTYIRWLRPETNSLITPQQLRSNGETQKISYSNAYPNDELQPFVHSNLFLNNKISSSQIQQCHTLQVSSGMQNKAPSTPTALGILLRSSIFRELVERNSNAVDNGVEVDETKQQQSLENGNESGENFYNGISNIPYVCSSQTQPVPKIELNEKNASSYFDCTEQSLWSNALSTSLL